METKPVDPSDPAFGELVGQAFAAQHGEQYVNLEQEPPRQQKRRRAPADEDTGNGEQPGFMLPGVGPVLMGPPPVATPLLVARILGPEGVLNPLSVAYCKAMMYVRSVDGAETKH